jgi:hypothetical protein
MEEDLKILKIELFSSQRSDLPQILNLIKQHLEIFNVNQISLRSIGNPR